MVYRTVTQNTCSHNAKVKMAGYKDTYECTTCHKFIHSEISKDEKNTAKDNTAPEYSENEWEDDE